MFSKVIKIVGILALIGVIIYFLAILFLDFSQVDTF